MNASRPPALYRAGALAARRRRLVLVVWAVAVAAGLALFPRFTGALTLAGLQVPGAESTRAAELLRRELPRAGGNQAVLVFSSSQADVGDPAFRAAVRDAVRNVSALPGVTGVDSPLGPAARDLVSPDRRVAVAVVALGGGEREAEKLAPRLAGAAERAETALVRVDAGGQPQLTQDMSEESATSLVRAEAVGLPVALLVLLAGFGTFVAAGLPLALALGGLALTFGVFAVADAVGGGGFNLFLENATSLIGLGLGIDYALFVVTRFREELGAGRDPAAAAAAATATAGRTVLFSGSTVILSLAPLLLVNAKAMRDLALGPMVAVAVTVAAALTLLPATLAALGARVDRLAPPVLRRLARPPAGRARRASRLTALVLRRPLAVLLPVAALLAAVGLFAARLQTGVDWGLAAMRDRPSGRAAATLAGSFGAGAVAPLRIVLQADGRPLAPRDVRVVARVSERLRADARVASAASLAGALGDPAAAARALVAARSDAGLARTLAPLVDLERGGDVTVVTAAPRVAFDSQQAAALVRDVRAARPGLLKGSGLRALVGGVTAEGVDLSDEIAAKTPLVIALVLLASFLLLTVAFRSVLVPLVGIAGTLLSVAAAYGLLVLVFQEGAGEAALGFTSPGFVQSYLPLLLFAILVGLSTDYQVFLVARIREEWERGGDAAAALEAGLDGSARVILSAAAIMFVVFAGFVLATMLEIKQIGFALAAAVFVDAALVRRLLVPAALRLLGERAWWLPRPLDRLLPETRFGEGGGGEARPG